MIDFRVAMILPILSQRYYLYDVISMIIIIHVKVIPIRETVPKIYLYDIFGNLLRQICSSIGFYDDCLDVKVSHRSSLSFTCNDLWCVVIFVFEIFILHGKWLMLCHILVNVGECRYDSDIIIGG